MNKKKSIAVAIVLALVLLIGGMLAYFTDTETAQNVFTLGDVDITLTETNWVATNGQGVVPGQTIPKNPVITNVKDTPAYVFAEVVVPCYATTGSTVDADLFTYTVNSGWTLISTSSIDTTAKTRTYVYAYGTASAMTSLAKNAATPAVFDNVTVVSTLTQEQAQTANTSPTIVVNAKGIQTTGYTETAPEDIYALF